MQTLLRPARRADPAPPRKWRRRLARFVIIPPAALVLVTVAAVLPWRWIAPPTTAFMLRERLTTGEPVAHTWVDWDGISPHVPIAAVAAEDQKFPIHSGFDWDAIGAAMDRNQREGSRRGGSTISQQVAKNLYLWPAQSWLRKGAEAYLTTWIEWLWPKRRILEVYLNVAEFGTGVYGIGEAGPRLRGRSAKDLGPEDAALLAAVLPSPARLSAERPSAYVRERASQIRRQVDLLGGAGYLKGIE